MVKFEETAETVAVRVAPVGVNYYLWCQCGPEALQVISTGLLRDSVMHGYAVLCNWINGRPY